MKLTSEQLETARAALGTYPIREDHPAMGQLKEAFGDHTFYFSKDHLLVFEPDEDPNTSDDTARLIIVAAWTDEEKKSLVPVKPRPTNIAVDLPPDGTSAPDR